jgi:hypothetical protein
VRQNAAIAAVKAARAVQPYILELGHVDHAGRLRKGDFVLVSQETGKN